MIERQSFFINTLLYFKISILKTNFQCKWKACFIKIFNIILQNKTAIFIGREHVTCRETLRDVALVHVKKGN